MSTVLILFCVLSAITLLTAFLTIFSRNPIHSAIYLTISKELVPASYEREDFIFGKDKLVMPLEMAMKNTQLKNAN